MLLMERACTHPTRTSENVNGDEDLAKRKQPSQRAVHSILFQVHKNRAIVFPTACAHAGVSVCLCPRPPFSFHPSKSFVHTPHQKDDRKTYLCVPPEGRRLPSTGKDSIYPPLRPIWRNHAHAERSDWHSQIKKTHT